MKTTIEIDEKLIKEAASLNGLKTENKVVEAGLRLLIQIGKQAPIKDLRGKLEWDDNIDDMSIDK
jgi:Arc/MetJ family transcription regulator